MTLSFHSITRSFAGLCVIAAVAGAQTTQPVADRSEGRSFRYGVCARVTPGDDRFDFKAVLQILDDLQVDTVRRDFYWDRIQPAAGQWNFALDDQAVDALRARGIDVEGILAYTAHWATTGDPNAKNWLDWSRAAPHMDAYGSFASGSAEHFKGRVKFWEMWNEPDIDFWTGTPQQYAELFNVGGAAVHKVDPDAKVINGGFALITRGVNKNFIPDFLQTASQKDWNIWAFHDYMTIAETLQRTDMNRRLYDQAKATTPIWINEGGFHTLNAGGEAEQAVVLAKKYALAPSLGVNGYFWYDLIDDGVDKLDPEHHFGLVRHDLTPKPAYYAYKNTIAQLAPRKFTQRVSYGDAALNALVYQGKSDNVLVLWRDGKHRETPLWVGSNAGAIGDSFDMLGQPLKTAAFGNGRVVNVTDAPIYVHYQGDAPPQVQPFFKLPDKAPLVAGKPLPLNIAVLNPTAGASDCQLTFTSTGDRLTFDPPQATLYLPASGQQAVAVTANVKAGAANDDSPGQIRVTFKGEGDSAMTATIPFEAAIVIPKATADATHAAEIKLDSRDHYVSLFEGVPKPEMQWHGPDDQTAIGHLSYDEKSLHLDVDVTDDTHSQANTDSDVWIGDSIQVAIRADDTQPTYLEFGLALTDKGSPTGWVYSTPANSSVAPGGWDDALQRTVSRTGNVTHYSVRIPWDAVGVKAPPKDGFRLNFIVNDNDGLGRKGWMQVSEGIGKVKNASLFRLFACE